MLTLHADIILPDKHEQWMNVIWWAGYPSQNSMTYLALQPGLMPDDFTHQGKSATTQWDN